MFEVLVLAVFFNWSVGVDQKHHPSQSHGKLLCCIEMCFLSKANSVKFCAVDKKGLRKRLKYSCFIKS